jgi:hypothetical protein
VPKKHWDPRNMNPTGTVATAAIAIATTDQIAV